VDVRVDARLHLFLNEGGMKVAGRDSDKSNGCHNEPQDGETQKRKAKELSYVNAMHRQGTDAPEALARAHRRYLSQLLSRACWMRRLRRRVDV
jgi:hypothetical protein